MRGIHRAPPDSGAAFHCSRAVDSTDKPWNDEVLLIGYRAEKISEAPRKRPE